MRNSKSAWIPEWFVGLGAIAALGMPAQAQQTLAVPSAFSMAPGTSRVQVPGLTIPIRHQIIVGQSHLVSLQGSLIQAIEFRRNGYEEVFQGGVANLQLSVSVCPRQPNAVSSIFDENTGQFPLIVFAGTVIAPTSPAPGGVTPAWSAGNTVRIQFQTPFPYTGGSLCLDLVGQPVPGQGSPFWAADAVAWSSDGALQDLGPGTGPTANDLGRWLFSEKKDLVAGGQLDMMGVGPLGGIALGFVGPPAPTPIPLSLLGIATPGANAYLGDVYLSQLVFFQPPQLPVSSSGFAYWNVQLPSETWILGVQLAAQWLELGSLNTSNGVGLVVGSSVPTLDMAQLVGSPAELFGDRSIVVAPILRFEYTTP